MTFKGWRGGGRKLGENSKISTPEKITVSVGFKVALRPGKADFPSINNMLEIQLFYGFIEMIIDCLRWNFEVEFDL